MLAAAAKVSVLRRGIHRAASAKKTTVTLTVTSSN